MADQVIHGPPGHGLVIGIAGKWGSGKTSVLKMVEEAVRERSNTVVVSFNPWLFSSAEELVSRFLEELGAQLKSNADKSPAGDLLRRVGDELSTYAETVEPFGWLPVLGPWLSRLGSLGRAYKGMREKRRELPSAEAQREQVRDQLAKLDRRVLVVIDDLDRIEPAQVRDMVRLVKLVGEFPNTTYLLAFDRGPVERALGDTPVEGRIYLEKIVQVIHDIPEPPPEALITLLLEELQAIVDTIPHGPLHIADWQNLLPEGVRPFFRTARDVRRYLNAIPVTLRVIGGEVALVDALVLELIRIFAPSAYAELPASIATLAGERRVLGEDSARRDTIDGPRVAAIVEAAHPHEEPVKEILQRLFPNIGHHLGGSRMIGHEQSARRDLRVADPNVLRTYLERTLPEGVVSGVLVSEAASLLGDRQGLEALFERLEPEAAEALIQRLEDYEYEYEPEAVEPALPVLVNQLARMREGRGRGMRDFGAEIVVGRVVLRLLRRVEDEAERLAMVERSLPAISTLTGRMELIDTVGHRENVGHRLVSAPASKRLYAELHREITVADPSELSGERGLAQLFVRIVGDDEEKGTATVRRLCANDGVFVQLLRSALSEQRAQTLGDYAVRTRPSLPWELLAKWLGDQALRERVSDVASRIDRDSLEPRSRAALETAEQYASGALTNERDDL